MSLSHSPVLCLAPVSRKYKQLVCYCVNWEEWEMKPTTWKGKTPADSSLHVLAKDTTPKNLKSKLTAVGLSLSHTHKGWKHFYFQSFETKKIKLIIHVFWPERCSLWGTSCYGFPCHKQQTVQTRMTEDDVANSHKTVMKTINKTRFHSSYRIWWKINNPFCSFITLFLNLSISELYLTCLSHAQDSSVKSPILLKVIYFLYTYDFWPLCW